MAVFLTVRFLVETLAFVAARFVTDLLDFAGDLRLTLEVRFAVVDRAETLFFAVRLVFEAGFFFEAALELARVLREGLLAAFAFCGFGFPLNRSQSC